METQGFPSDTPQIKIHHCLKEIPQKPSKFTNILSLFGYSNDSKYPESEESKTSNTKSKNKKTQNNYVDIYQRAEDSQITAQWNTEITQATKLWDYCKRIKKDTDDVTKFLKIKNKRQEDKIRQDIDKNYSEILRDYIASQLKPLDISGSAAWADKLFDLVNKSVSQISPSFKYLKDTMNITDYIKVKTLENKDISYSRVIDGFAMHKNVCSKRMPIAIDDPKIWIIDCDLDFNNVSNSPIDDCYTQEPAYINWIKKQIEHFEPDLILVKKSIAQKLQEEWVTNKSLSIVWNVKSKSLKKIARCTKTVPITSLDWLEKRINVGRCKKFKIEKIKKSKTSYLQSDTQNDIIRSSDYSLMVFEGCDNVLFNTIILAGENLGDLKVLKHWLKDNILVTARDLYLQKFILYYSYIDIAHDIAENINIDRINILNIWTNNTQNGVNGVNTAKEAAQKEAQKDTNNINNKDTNNINNKDTTINNTNMKDSSTDKIFDLVRMSSLNSYSMVSNKEFSNFSQVCNTESNYSNIINWVGGTATPVLKERDIWNLNTWNTNIFTGMSNTVTMNTKANQHFHLFDDLFVHYKNGFDEQGIVTDNTSIYFVKLTLVSNSTAKETSCDTSPITSTKGLATRTKNVGESMKVGGDADTGNANNYTESDIWSKINAICSVEELQWFFYSANEVYDKPWGKLIIDITFQASNKCEKCKKNLLNHIYHWYHCFGRLTIQCWKSVKDDHWDKVLQYINRENSTWFTKYTPAINKHETSSIDYDIDIFMYGHCRVCNCIVTPVTKLPKEMYNLSSARYFKHWLYNNEMYNRNDLKEYNISLFTDVECTHNAFHDISRVFITNYGNIQISYSPVCKYRVENYVHSEKKDAELIRNVVDSSINYSKDKENKVIDLWVHNYDVAVDEIWKLEKEEVKNKLVQDNCAKLKVFITANLLELQEIKTYIHGSWTQTWRFTDYAHLQIHWNKISIKWVQLKIKSNNIRKAIQKIKNYMFILKALTTPTWMNKENQTLVTPSFTLFERVSVVSKVDEGKKSILMPTQLNANTQTGQPPQNMSGNTVQQSHVWGLNSHHNQNQNTTPPSHNNDTESSLSLIFPNKKATEYNNIDSKNCYRFLWNQINYYDDFHTQVSTGVKETDLASIIAYALMSDKYVGFISKNNKFNWTSVRCERKLIKIETCNICANNIFTNNKDDDMENMKEAKPDSWNCLPNCLPMPLSNDCYYEQSWWFDHTRNGYQYKEYDKNKIVKQWEMELLSDEKEPFVFDVNSISKKQIEDLNVEFSCIDKKKSNEYSSIFPTNLGPQSPGSENNLTWKGFDGVNNIQRVKNTRSTMNVLNGLSPSHDHIQHTHTIKPTLTGNNGNIGNINGNINGNTIGNIGNNTVINWNPTSPYQNSPQPEAPKQCIEDTTTTIIEQMKSEKHKLFNEYKNKLSTNDTEIRHKFKFQKIEFCEDCWEHSNIEVIAYFPRQFEALRIAYCSTYSEFVLSIAQSYQWSNVSGGKSKSEFYKSWDNKYIIKSWKQKEFIMFIESGFQYFHHNAKYLFHKMPSALAKIWGAFKVKILKGENCTITHYCVIMENVFNGIDIEKTNIKVYDLKGSNINRYVKRGKSGAAKGKVLWDTNFKEIQNGEPIVWEKNMMDLLNAAVHNDSLILTKMNVIDYSWLVILNESENESERCVRFGIIDYIRKYTWDKQWENIGKTIMNGWNSPTIISPINYKERWMKAIGEYFIGLKGYG